MLLLSPLAKLIRCSSNELNDGRRYARKVTPWSHAGGGGEMPIGLGGGETVAAKSVCAIAVNASVEVRFKRRAACRSEPALI